MNANRIIATKGLSHRVAMSLNEGCRLKIFLPDFVPQPHRWREFA
ncbi:hypothetical protein MSKU9_3238 [Komagataeibacter diospyri]|uniref:Uncharacterized protein n=1 Tax=Komagataeibacter diospyri TaxID=1932662 RepID=A0A4P5NXF9_9PROT|nr:hypothetical protein MSKU9_3238 [Komagataeibacter diospyri]